jgi:hypothetical protein
VTNLANVAPMEKPCAHKIIAKSTETDFRLGHKMVLTYKNMAMLLKTSQAGKLSVPRYAPLQRIRIGQQWNGGWNRS